MRPPFPGMDPWLEQPGLWPDLHDSLITSIRDDLAAKIAPKYFAGIQQHTYITTASGSEVGIIIPDVLIARTAARKRPTRPRRTGTATAVAVAEPQVETEVEPGAVELDVAFPTEIRVESWYLEIRSTSNGRLVTVIEVLSPTNKNPGAGRKEYLRKRRRILKSRSSLVEIDLLRDGRPMPIVSTEPINIDYRILVGRGEERPSARFYGFGVRNRIPLIPIPLLPEDPEPKLDLGAVLHALYDRARFDLRLDYRKPPIPPLKEDDAGWARDILAASTEAERT